jgi:hypothetical protein
MARENTIKSHNWGTRLQSQVQRMDDVSTLHVSANNLLFMICHRTQPDTVHKAESSWLIPIFSPSSDKHIHTPLKKKKNT